MRPRKALFNNDGLITAFEACVNHAVNEPRLPSVGCQCKTLLRSDAAHCPVPFTVSLAVKTHAIEAACPLDGGVSRPLIDLDLPRHGFGRLRKTVGTAEFVGGKLPVESRAMRYRSEGRLCIGLKTARGECSSAPISPDFFTL